MSNDDVTESDDALTLSTEVQTAIAATGFDWEHVDGVLEKVEEELGEIREAIQEGDVVHARKELGDLLLIAVNLARFLEADPRRELLDATHRLKIRFACMKEALEKAGESVKTCAPDELEACWQRIKPEADKRLREGA